MIVKIIWRPGKGLGTEGTTIRCNLVTVRAAKMFVKMSLLPEPVETQDALEGSLTRVRPEVDREVGLPAELALTHRTQELLPAVLVRRGVVLLYKILMQLRLL